MAATHSNASVINDDLGESLLFLDKHWSLHQDEYINALILIPAYDYTVISTSILYDCQLQERNEFFINL